MNIITAGISFNEYATLSDKMFDSNTSNDFNDFFFSNINMAIMLIISARIHTVRYIIYTLRSSIVFDNSADRVFRYVVANLFVNSQAILFSQ